MNKLIFLAFVALSLLPTSALADPCGMVPPVWEGQGPAITRVGPQKTYVFFKDGVQTIAIRPAFKGEVDNFGMLVPLPSVPSIRKIDESTFAQLDNALAPPPVTIDLRPPPPMANYGAMRGAGSGSGRTQSVGKGNTGLRVDEVRVVRQEAVGMYQIAVLEAGSPKALDRWMGDHGYAYPKGMDRVVRDYVRDRWVFVAVKARVGVKSRVDPRPGMRKANPKMKPGGSFDGHVQAMAFRFLVKRPVIPMRLSTFNESEAAPVNVIYYLGEGGVKLRALPTTLVARQVGGDKLYRNMTDLLPLRLILSQDSHATMRSFTQAQLKSTVARRNPEPHLGAARRLFSADLVAARSRRLTLDFESVEKQLLNVSERLNLRGSEVDAMHNEAIRDRRDASLKAAETGLREMTLTELRGEIPVAHLARHNLKLERFRWYPGRGRKTAKPSLGVQSTGTGGVGIGLGIGRMWGLPSPSWEVPLIDRAYAEAMAKKHKDLAYWPVDEVWAARR